MRKLTSLFFIVTIACNQATEVSEQDILTEGTVQVVEEESTVDPEVEFLHVYSLLVKALYEKNDTEIAEFIHPKHGIKLITNFSGAMPQLMEYKNMAHFDHDEEVRLKFENLDSLILIDGIIESFPKVICNESTYEKDGCFAQQTNNNLKQHPWNAEEKYNELINTIKWTVVNTYYFTFYFSEIEGQYYLTFIDIRTHCSA